MSRASGSNGRLQVYTAAMGIATAEEVEVKIEPRQVGERQVVIDGELRTVKVFESLQDCLQRLGLSDAVIRRAKRQAGRPRF